MIQTIELEEECPDCLGGGELWNTLVGWEPCETCRSLGMMRETDYLRETYQTIDREPINSWGVWYKKMDPTR